MTHTTTTPSVIGFHPTFVADDGSRHSVRGTVLDPSGDGFIERPGHEVIVLAADDGTEVTIDARTAARLLPPLARFAVGESLVR